MSAPELDVGIVTWNTAQLTTDAITRLKETTREVRLRILLRDNGSQDGTPDIVARAHPEVIIERGRENLGFAGGMNRLIRRSEAPWFLALNSDAWPRTGAVRRLLDAGTCSPSAAAVAPRLERPDGELEHSTHPFPSEMIAAITALGGHRRLPARITDRLLLEPAWGHDRPRDVDWAVGAVLLMRRSAIEQVGGFDEGFFMYAEDLAWCHRAHGLGWTIRFTPASVFVHVGNASGARRYGTRRTRAYLENTARWYEATHGPLRARCYAWINAAGAARAQLAARRAGDDGAVDHWRQVRHVHRAATPEDDTSRPAPDQAP